MWTDVWTQGLVIFNLILLNSILNVIIGGQRVRIIIVLKYSQNVSFYCIILKY